MPELKDDASILDNEVLWRRIWPDWIVWPQTTAVKPRPASVAFQDRIEGRVSASIARETTKCKLLRCYPSHSLVSIPVSRTRALGYRIARRPTPEDPAHVLIFPSPNKSHARQLAQSAEWVVLRDSRRKWDTTVVYLLGVWRRVTIEIGLPCPSQHGAEGRTD
jgi:hypothetical protein